MGPPFGAQFSPTQTYPNFPNQGDVGDGEGMCSL